MHLSALLNDLEYLVDVQHWQLTTSYISQILLNEDASRILSLVVFVTISVSECRLYSMPGLARSNCERSSSESSAIAAS